jgi:hypothetical protein
MKPPFTLIERLGLTFFLLLCVILVALSMWL